MIARIATLVVLVACKSDPAPQTPKPIVAVIDAGIAVAAIDAAVKAIDAPSVAPDPDPRYDDPPRGRISIADEKALDTTSLTIDAVLHKIQAQYIPGLVRCYTQALRHDPALRGKLHISFTVSTTGRTKNPQVTGFDDDVASCTKTRIAAWLFPIPRDHDSAPSEASFEIGFSLAPE